MNNLDYNIGIDLGTSSVRFYKDGKLILETPPQIQIDGEWINDIIVEGNIARMWETQKFLLKHLSDILHFKKFWIVTIYRYFTVLASVRCNQNDIQLSAYYNVMKRACARKAYMLNHCFILATGLGIDLKKDRAMIVDFGAGKTSITTLQGTEIIQNEFPPISGRSLDEIIKTCLRHQYQLDITLHEAEQLKIEHVDFRKNAVFREVCIKGLLKNTETPHQITLNTARFNEFVRNDIEILIGRIVRHLENLEPSMQNHLKQGHIYLTGGALKLKGLIDLVAEKIPVSAKSYQMNTDYMRLGFERIQMNPENVYEKMMN